MVSKKTKNKKTKKIKGNNVIVNENAANVPRFDGETTTYVTQLAEYEYFSAEENKNGVNWVNYLRSYFIIFFCMLVRVTTKKKRKNTKLRIILEKRKKLYKQG